MNWKLREIKLDIYKLKFLSKSIFSSNRFKFYFKIRRRYHNRAATQDLLTPSELVNVVNMSLGSVEGEEEHTRSKSPPARSICSIRSNRPYSKFDSTKSMQLHIRKYTNLYLNPKKLTNKRLSSFNSCN